MCSLYVLGCSRYPAGILPGCLLPAPLCPITAYRTASSRRPLLSPQVPTLQDGLVRGHLSCIPDSLSLSLMRIWCLGHLLRPEGGCLVAQIGEVTQLNETLWALSEPNILPRSQTPPGRQARHQVCRERGTKWTGSSKGRACGALQPR